MVQVETVLLGVAVVGVLWAILLLLSIRRQVRAAGDLDADTLSSALSRSWRDLEFDETVGRIEGHADRLRGLHEDIAALLRAPQHRGEFGEQQLDVILSDHLPPEMYGIREQVVEGTTPDAHIRSASGLICIDSKFPLDNYERFLGAEDAEERDRAARQFRRDVESQLEKIATDYVRPAAGTADFAFAFIPSESVYYHLVTEEYDLLRSFTNRGVQVVSPLTLGHKLELIKADVQARKLSEEAEAVLDRLADLRERFDTLEDEWDTLERHIQNAANKADDVDGEYRNLRAAFDRVDGLSLDDRN